MFRPKSCCLSKHVGKGVGLVFVINQLARLLGEMVEACLMLFSAFRWELLGVSSLSTCTGVCSTQLVFGVVVAAAKKTTYTSRDTNVRSNFAWFG